MQPAHVSERNAVVTFQKLDAAWREKLALRKRSLASATQKLRRR
jgi:hypothetical protein